MFVVFFKQKTAYEMRISDWSSDVCSSDLEHVLAFRVIGTQGRTVQLSIGTTDNGGELVSDIEYGVGYHVVAFTPTVSPFYAQFKNPSNRTEERRLGKVCCSTCRFRRSTLS